MTTDTCAAHSRAQATILPTHRARSQPDSGKNKLKHVGVASQQQQQLQQQQAKRLNDRESGVNTSARLFSFVGSLILIIIIIIIINIVLLVARFRLALLLQLSSLDMSDSLLDALKRLKRQHFGRTCAHVQMDSLAS